MKKVNKKTLKKFDRAKLISGDSERVLAGSTCPNCQCASCSNCNVCHSPVLTNINDYVKEVYI